jgi:hypothetical protein
MKNEPAPTGDVRKVWQNQETEGIRMSLDDIRRGAAKYRRRILWRNAREYAAGLIVLVFFAIALWRGGDALFRTGFGLIMAGVLFVMWQLYLNGTPRKLSEQMGLASCLAFHRDELERQRDLLRGVWRWYLGPLIPGLVVVTIAALRVNPRHLPHFGWWIAAYAIVAALLFVYIGRLNARAADLLQRKIDQLNALNEPG